MKVAMHLVACLETTLLVFVFAKAAGSNVCPLNPVNLSCENMRSSEGYKYSLPAANILCSGNTHCDEGWYQNGTLIVDPKNSEKRLPVVTDVTSDSLTVKDCVNLKWELECGKCTCTINYIVTDSRELHSAGLTGWGIALIVIGIVLVVAACIIIGVCCSKTGKSQRSNENGVV